MRCHYSHHEITECENSNVECLLAVSLFLHLTQGLQRGNVNLETVITPEIKTKAY